MRATLVTDERTNFCARRLPLMSDDYSKFLEEVAAELTTLAERAPDIARELRRFADDLIRMASGVGRRDDASSEPD
jgi:hypothetical protein